MKMFINRKHTATRTLSLIASLALAFTSCVQLDEEQEGAYGYLTISGFDVDVQVEQLLPTKAEETKVSIENIEGYPENLSELTVTVTDSKGVVHTWEGKALSLPSGPYTVNAELNSNGFGAPWLQGTATGTLGNTTETVALSLSLMNSVMKVNINSDLSGHFTVGGEKAVKFSSSTGSIETSINTYVFVPSEEYLTVNVVGKNSLDNESIYNTTLTQKTAVGKAHDVIINKDGNNWPTIELGDLNAGAFEQGLYFSPSKVSSHLDGQKVTYQIKESGASEWENITPTEVSDGKYLFIGELSNDKAYSLRASVGAFSSEKTFTPKAFANCITITSVDPRHSYTNNELDGTDVKAEIKAELPSIIAELAQLNTNCTFKNASSEIRTFTSVLSNENGENTIESGKSDANWPYIPKGSNHTLEVSTTCTLPNRTLTTKSSISGIEVPAPEFKVDVSAYTTYDWYLAGNLTNANNYDKRLKVEDRKVVLKISNSILQNANYSSLLKSSSVTYSGEILSSFSVSSTASNTLEYDDVTYKDNQWGSYSFIASVTFDEVTATDTHNCHITGLPYQLNPASNDGWTEEGTVSWNTDGGVRLGYYQWSGNAFIKRSFKIPQNINTVINSSGVVNGTGSWIKVDNTFTLDISGTTAFSSTVDGNSPTAYNCINKSVQMSSSNPEVKLNSSYNLEQAYVRINSLTIAYGNK